MTHKVFRDAVHNIISLHRESDTPAKEWVDWGDALILDLIDTPQMQRLRRIHQLGPAYQVYPSAEHSRFSHALGTLHLSKRILETLLHRPNPPFDRTSLLQIKVAALLHDLGHGPYSHVFELIMPNRVDHETWGWRILEQEEAPRQVIRRHCKRLGLDEILFMKGLKSLLGAEDISEETLFGRQLISSQLDADRMDYLLRDAHFTGVFYGRYDLEWLLHSLRAHLVNGKYVLCVDISKGPAALESYVIARDHMYRQVYDHKTVRAFEMLMVHLFQLMVWRWKEEGGLPPSTPVALVRFIESIHCSKEVSVSDYLALDDTVLDCAIGQWSQMVPTCASDWELRWKSRLFRNRKPVYRRLQWFLKGRHHGVRVNEQMDDPEAADAVDRFFLDNSQTLLTLTSEEGVYWQMPLYLLVRVDRLERAPYAHLQYMPGKAEPIMVEDGFGVLLPAEHASEQINQLGQSRRKLAWVFCDPRVVPQVNQLLKDHFKHPNISVCENPSNKTKSR